MNRAIYQLQVLAGSDTGGFLTLPPDLSSVHRGSDVSDEDVVDGGKEKDVAMRRLSPVYRYPSSLFASGSSSSSSSSSSSGSGSSGSSGSASSSSSGSAGGSACIGDQPAQTTDDVLGLVQAFMNRR